MTSSDKKPQEPQIPQHGGASTSYMPSYTEMPTIAPPAQSFAGNFPAPQGAPGTYPSGQPIPPVGPSAGFAAMPSVGQQPYHPSYGQPPVPVYQDPLVYLGAAIPHPDAPKGTLTAAKLPGYDASRDFEAIKEADKKKKKVFEETLIDIFTTRSVLQIDALNDYSRAKGVPLKDYVEKTRSHFHSGLQALMLGPVGYDAYLLRESMKGAGTNEKALVEVILGRESSEIRWLNAEYLRQHGRSLVNDIQSETSGTTSKMLSMALAAQRPPAFEPVNNELVIEDVERLHVAARGIGVDTITFFEILINRSTPHISRVIGEYGRQFKSLSKVIKKEFSGTVRLGLLHIVHGMKPKRDGQGYYRDAKLLEQAMKGFGTDDDALVWRIVRAYWDPSRLQQVKDAYYRKYGKALEDRVRGETSGAYRDLMIALIRSNEKKN